MRLVGSGQSDARAFVSREELKALLQMEPGEADVTTQEAEMIDKIFDLGDTTVREVMVPLVDVVMLPDTATAAEAIATIQQRGFSRMPVSCERETNVVGVVTAMDLLHRGAEVRTVAELDANALLRARDQAHRRPPARDAARAHCSWPLSSTSTVGAREPLPSRTSWSRSSARSRTSTTGRRPPWSSLPDGSYWISARTHIDELNETLDWQPAQEGLRDHCGVGPVHLAPHPSHR